MQLGKALKYRTGPAATHQIGPNSQSKLGEVHAHQTGHKWPHDKGLGLLILPELGSLRRTPDKPYQVGSWVEKSNQIRTLIPN